MVTFSLEPSLIPLLHVPHKGPLAENTHALCYDVSIVGFLFSSPTDTLKTVSVTFAPLLHGS